MKIALVTGASGFIGNRLVETLLDRGWAVRALTRRAASMSRLARYDIQVVLGDIADASAIYSAVDGCAVVFHCAYDYDTPQANIEAADSLAKACVANQVDRLVHVSTFAVYQPFSDGVLDETQKAEMSGWVYPDTKLAVERRLLDQYSVGLPVVALQPTIVYGPHGGGWTEGIVRRLRKKRVVLPANGEGLCTPVYIDDLVSALLRSADADGVVGERILISGPSVVTWADYYRAFEDFLGFQSVVKVPSADDPAVKPVDRKGGKEMLTRLLRQGPIRRVVKPVLSLVGEKRIGKLKKEVMLPPLDLPDDEAVSLYSAKVKVDISKARRLLDYEPTFDFDRGMDLTRSFLEWANV